MVINGHSNRTSLILAWCLDNSWYCCSFDMLLCRLFLFVCLFRSCNLLTPEGPVCIAALLPNLPVAFVLRLVISKMEIQQLLNRTYASGWKGVDGWKSCSDHIPAAQSLKSLLNARHGKCCFVYVVYFLELLDSFVVKFCHSVCWQLLAGLCGLCSLWKSSPKWPVMCLVGR